MHIEGTYHDISYKISYIEHDRFGPYYDVQLFIGNELKAHERTSTPLEAINRLIVRLQSWDLDDKGLRMSPEQAERRIAEWKAAWKLITSMPADEGESERAREAMATIFKTSIDLCAAGYCTNESLTDWHLPSEL
jgi:hypothetical protein